MKNSRVLVVATVVTLGLIAGLFWLWWPEKVPEKVPLAVRLSWLHQAQFAGLYLAVDKGFYRDAGIAVDLKAGGLEYPSIKMAVTGSDDLGLTSADQILLARAKGARVIALAAMYQKSPAVLFSLKSSGIQKPEDLRGKRVGLKIGDNSEIPIRAMLRKSGLAKGDFTEVPVSYDPTPLIEGRVDAFADWAINAPLSVEEKGYDVNLMFPASYGLNMYADVFFTTEHVLATKRAELVAFLRATMRGYDYAIQHEDEAVAATLRRDPTLKREHELRMLRASVALWRTPGKRLGEMTDDDWSGLNDGLHAAGVIRSPLDLRTVVNHDLWAEAMKGPS